MSDELTTIYATKYLFTDGIKEYQARIDGGMAVVKQDVYYPLYLHGKDWHLTKEEALRRAEEMRIKKLQSLDKQVKKISAMKFE